MMEVRYHRHVARCGLCYPSNSKERGSVMSPDEILQNHAIPFG